MYSDYKILIIVTKYCFFKPLRPLQHPIFIFAGIEIEYIVRIYHRTFFSAAVLDLETRVKDLDQ